MKKIIAILCLATASFALLSGAPQEKRAFASYAEMRKYLGELYAQKKYGEAAELLESVFDAYPDNVAANTYNLATMRLLQGDLEKAMSALEEGHRRGVFYGLWDFQGEFWAPLKKFERFASIEKENAARLEAAQKKASLKIEIETPEGYDPAKKYPLFIALHGGGESIAELKPNWISPRLRSEFITAFLQSPQVASMKGFHWQDEARTCRDVEDAYKQILEKYPVDTDRVLIGGFSSGGFGSIIVAFSSAVPVRGFVALCPEPPQTLRDEDILAAKTRGLKGTLLTTERDNRLDRQRNLFDRWKKLGLTVEFHVTPDIGHWFPPDFGRLLDQAIEQILSSGGGKTI
ncbi:MAG: tetratricopeptide repeat protein [Candidatus Aminicenantales bacterium]